MAFLSIYGTGVFWVLVSSYLIIFGYGCWRVGKYIRRYLSGDAMPKLEKCNVYILKDGKLNLVHSDHLVMITADLAIAMTSMLGIAVTWVISCPIIALVIMLRRMRATAIERNKIVEKLKNEPE